MKIIPIIFLSILLILLIVWSICDSTHTREKNMNLGTQYLVYQYIQKSYLYVLAKLMETNRGKYEIKSKTKIMQQFNQQFTNISISLTKNLENFIRGPEIIKQLYDHQNATKNDLFLFPDVIVERSKQKYYSQLLSTASSVIFSKDPFSNFSNQEAKLFLERL